MNKMTASEAGTVLMADGTRRAACRNTYKVMTNSADGTSVAITEDVRVEFELFTNANTSKFRKFRKTTPKQAATFQAN